MKDFIIKTPMSKTRHFHLRNDMHMNKVPATTNSEEYVNFDMDHYQTERVQNVEIPRKRILATLSWG